MRQIDFFEEMIIDNFAGGGGASTGIEFATGRAVDAAINHDPDAILMHRTNHPQTRHYCESVWDIDPWEVTRGRPVGLAWFSPDCKHFSKAKGSKPVDRNIRGLAWIVLKWAGTVKPRVIILENVEEFQTWGPVRKGKPVKSRRGETFRKWKEQLQVLGYEIEHRELVAADYGAPTIRKRFFLIARCDGKKIIWPERTHAPKDSEEVKNGKCKPWRGAAEIIDWTIPCPSIFDTTDEIKEKYGIRAVRPLAVNTQKRIARGIEKFVLQNKEPFIVPIGYGERKGQAPRVHDIKEPVSTVVSSGKQYLCQPELSPFIVQVNHKGEQFRGQELKEPIPTITGKHGYGLATPVMTAIAVSKAEQCLAMPSLIQYHTEQSERVRGQGMDEPIMTLDAANRYGLSVAYLAEYFQNGRPLDVNSPLHTSTTKDRECLCMAHMEKFFSGGYTGNGSDANTPLGTVTAVDHNGLVETFISKFYKTGIGQKPDEPLHTVTTSAGHFGVVTVKMSRSEMNLHHWNEVRELLNAYCGYAIAEDEILLLDVNGTLYFISDIGLRMLTPRELYAANGFPPDYIIDHDYTGKAYGKTKQVARCGNAVPPPFAEALVRANLPEMCGRQFETMKELHGVI
ncbi:DNA cytosine methyltransferase [Anaerotignum faecicola]|nr:DNA cytosine methyltransferase [Anaerotignum faecicola]